MRACCYAGSTKITKDEPGIFSIHKAQNCISCVVLIIKQNTKNEMKQNGGDIFTSLKIEVDIKI